MAASLVAQDGPLGLRGFQPTGNILRGDFSISGIVENSVTREPVKRALVQLVGRGGNRWMLADTSGVFRIADLGEGQYRIIANKPGFGRIDVSKGVVVTVGPSAHDQVIIRVDPLAVIRGRVVNSYGEPADGVLIQAFTATITDGRREITWDKSSTTDDRGEYRIADLNPGTYLLRAAGRSGRVRMFIGQRAPVADTHESFMPVYYDRAPDRLSARSLTLQAGQQVLADFSLVLEPAYKISGEIANFGSYRTIEVDLLTKIGELAAGRTSVNASTGRFQIADVVPGSYLVRATQGKGEGATTAVKEINLTNSDLDGVRLELVPGVSITGAVTVDGAKNDPRAQADGVSVSLAPADDPSDTDRLYTGIAAVGNALAIRNVQQGVYRIKLEPVGAKYVASARSGDVDLLENPSISVGVNAIPPIEIVMRSDAGSIEGKVNMKGQSVERANIIVARTSGKRSPLIGATTGNGHFLVGTVPPGEYLLYAFDSLMNVEYVSQSVLATFGPGAMVHVEPNGRVEAQLEMIVTNEK